MEEWELNDLAVEYAYLGSRAYQLASPGVTHDADFFEENVAIFDRLREILARLPGEVGGEEWIRFNHRFDYHRRRLRG